MKDKYPSRLAGLFYFRRWKVETGKDLKKKIKEFGAVKKQIQKLQGQYITVSCGSGRDEVRISGKIDEVYNHIFTVQGQFKEAFSYADVFSGQVRLIGGRHDNT